MKKMKKFLAVLLSTAMVASLTACGGEESGNSAPGGTESASASSGTSVDKSGNVITNYDDAVDELITDKEMPHYTILVTYFAFTDKLGSQYKSSLEYLGKALNVDFVFVETGMGEESQSIIEAALVNKPDAWIANTCTVADVKAAADAGNIPYVSCGSVFPSEEVAEEMASYDNFLGAIGVDDYGAGYSAAEALYEDGSRNVVLCGAPKGMAGQHDQRAFGFLDGVAAHEDMELIGEDYSMMEFAPAITSFAATYPELDGVFCSCIPEAVYNAFVTEDLVGSVRLGGLDVSESTGDYFDNGTLSYMAAGNYVTNMLGFATVYNYLLDGTRIIDNPADMVVWNNINLRNSEDYNNYITYLDSGIPAYTAREIQDMVHYYNPEMKAEDFRGMGKAFTLEDVMARHEGLVK